MIQKQDIFFKMGLFYNGKNTLSKVCHNWNNFIVQNVWQTKLGKKLIERRLAKNKSAGQLCYDKTLEITDIGIENIEIFSAFGDNVEKFSGWWVETLQL